MPLHFDPGDAFQFDWSEDFAVLGGERMKLQMAHIKLSHSRAFLLRAYPLQTHEMLFDAHWQAFRVFGGVPARGIYDNMRTAVDRVGRGKERQVNMRFLAMTNHYVYEPEFCNPAADWEKGQVEKNVRDSRHQMLQKMPDFPDLAALNAWLEERCLELWRQTPHGKQPGTIADVWADEQASLMPLPVAFDGFVELSKRVSPTCLISFERNRYNVPASFANRPVSLRIYPDRLVVAAEDNILCEHVRVVVALDVFQPRAFDGEFMRALVAVRQPAAPVIVAVDYIVTGPALVDSDPQKAGHFAEGHGGGPELCIQASLEGVVQRALPDKSDHLVEVCLELGFMWPCGQPGIVQHLTSPVAVPELPRCRHSSRLAAVRKRVSRQLDPFVVGLTGTGGGKATPTGRLPA